ncbi:unnamed protein product [Sphagnum troendelagicum]|uniref:NADP-dependent oxidoreductase domain-containing protein n=1 Tax=Sphagnum troendelagicum TaxID=128251 RepID=A0ABP0U7X8_9BRYO
MSTTFVCLENPYEVPTSTLCWSTSQIVELAPNWPSIKLPLSGHVSGSLDAGNHINPKLGFLKHLDMEYGTVWKVEVEYWTVWKVEVENGTVWKVEVEYAPLHKNYGLGLSTWSPLTSSVISGKCSKGNIPEGNHFALENYKSLANQSLMADILNKVEKLRPVAAEFNVPMSQLAISWCAKNPNGIPRKI